MSSLRRSVFALVTASVLVLGAAAPALAVDTPGQEHLTMVCRYVNGVRQSFLVSQEAAQVLVPMDDWFTWSQCFGGG